MKLALKYGISVALVIAVWVGLRHFVLHLESQPAQIAAVVIFNAAAIGGLDYWFTFTPTRTSVFPSWIRAEPSAFLM